MFSLRSILLLGCSLTAACVTPSATGDGEDGGDGGDGSSGTTIYDIQKGNVGDGELATLSGVLVTTPITADGKGFYVMDPAGGEYSGVYVYLQGTFPDLHLEVGDEVRLSGQVSEYYDFTELTVGGETDIEVTGYGEVEPAHLGSAPTDWEPWEGVLIELADQAAEDCPDSYFETEISAGVELNDAFFEYETERGATYDAIVGALEYSFSEWKLNPRSQDDFVGYVAGEGCGSTVAEVQQGGENGDGISLTGVVATSTWTRAGDGFFVQDPGGGEWSGIFVYIDETKNDGSLSVSVGDTLDISGSISEYYDYTEVKLASLDDAVVTGTGTPVAVELSEAPADWEPYEGGLVTLHAPTATSTVSSYGECSTDFDITLDDGFYQYDAGDGTTWDSVTGLVSYSYEEWKLNPRGGEDLVNGSGGSGGDVIEATVAEIQGGDVAEDDTVALTGVVATTGLDASGRGFYVQDRLGGAWSGIYIYVSRTVEVSPGDVLDITGTVTEYYDLTEIKADAGDIAATGTGSVAVDIFSSAPSDWEPWEGTLVTLSGLELTSSADSHGAATTSYGPLIDDCFYDWSADLSNGDSADVTGVVTYTFDEFRICPRDSSDVK